MRSAMPQGAFVPSRAPSLGRRFLFTLLNVVFFDAYRPERHYMRGPGPKWCAKHDRAGPVERSDDRQKSVMRINAPSENRARRSSAGAVLGLNSLDGM